MNRILRALKIQPSERRMVGLIALLFGLSEAGRGLGMNASDALFFLRYGVDRLPWMYMGLGALTFLAIVGYAAGLARYRWRFLQAMYLFIAALLVVERLVVPLGYDVIYPVLWLTVNVVAWVLVTTAWNVAGQAFDTRQAKRLFSLFASASILGGVIGNGVTGVLADTLGTPNLYFIYSGLLLGGFLVVRRISNEVGPSPVARPRGRTALDDLLTGVRYLKRSPLMRLIAIVSVLTSVLFFSVAFPFSQVVSASFPDEAAVAGFLGNFTSIVMFSTLLLSLFLASRLYEKLGVVNVFLIVPLIYLAGFGMWALSFTLVTAAVLRFAQLVWINGAGWTAWNALFNVYRSEKRSQLRAFESGVPAQFGIALSGVLLLLGERTLSNQQIFVLGGVTALVCAVLCWRMRVEYGRALVDAIRSGIVDVFTGPTRAVSRLGADAQARSTALAALTDSDPGIRKAAAQILGRMQVVKAAEPLRKAAEDESADVRRAAVTALGALQNQVVVPALKARLDDRDPAVRQAAVRSLCKLGAAQGDWLDRALADQDSAVRASAGAYLHLVAGSDRGLEVLNDSVVHGKPEAQRSALEVVADDQIELPLSSLRQALSNKEAAVQRAALDALVPSHGPTGAELALEYFDHSDRRVAGAAAVAAVRLGVDTGRLLHRLEDGARAEQRTALEALQAADDSTGPRLFDWIRKELEQLRQLNARIRTLQQWVRAADEAACLYLVELLQRRASETTDLILRALGVLGSEETMNWVARGLRSERRELRSQAMEALETLGDPRIVEAFMPLIEGEPEYKHDPTVTEVFYELSRDESVWVRALALHLRAARQEGDLEELERLVESDPASLVAEMWQDAGETAGGEMTETVDTLSMMERILCLRQVPALAELDPDDLHQIAAIAEEVWIPQGEYLCREGEVDDELYVIVEGEVRVTKLDEDGVDKYIRTLGKGDHVGELAIICRQPRSASVQAHPDDVQALMIGGEAFDAILRDRPEVARALLTSLARRLSSQV